MNDGGAPFDDGDEDPFVPVWEGPTTEAIPLASAIERSHIPVDLGEATFVGHSRIEVPRSYEEDARRVIALGGDAPPALTRARLDYGPAMRITLIVVALGLIMLMIFFLIPG